VSRTEAFEEGMDRPLAMAAEAVRRHVARQYGIAHDAPNAPQVLGVRSQAKEYEQKHLKPEATHHVTVQHDEPQVSNVHVYGVNPAQEYMHEHTVIRTNKQTHRPITRFTPG
jgi:hypothetical protein